VTGPEVEVIGRPAGEGIPSLIELKRLCAGTLARVGVTDGHVAIEFVDEDRIRELNRHHRGLDRPTDVLSFGVDEDGPAAGPRELGDIVICPARTEDVGEAVVHGVLHLAGMDHETDAGEMLKLQDDLLRSRGRK
jgi:probable rRNA maturation factor